MAVVLLLSVGLNISLSRKEHRVAGFFYLIPIIGLVYGICEPIFIIIPFLLRCTYVGKMVYSFIIYGILLFLLFVFYKKGKNWRKWFSKNMKHRHLQKWESFLLCTVGVLMLLFSITTDYQIESYKSMGSYSAYDYGYFLGRFADMFVRGSIAFFISIIIIIMVMQGNKRAYYNKQVVDMQFHIITTMADIVESRDENTGGHIRRTAKYVEIISTELKKRGLFKDILTDKYIEDMIVAAPLHDIGKIHISDSILNKPGRFTDEEFEIMKGHTTAGKDLLNHAKSELGEFDYLNIAVEMAAYHHEWWNGKGYPKGISGQEIPLCARIMAVADVFDALTSKRCYKSAMPLDKVYKIMREETGTHFDPVIMEAFFAANEDIEKILE